MCLLRATLSIRPGEYLAAYPFCTRSLLPGLNAKQTIMASLTRPNIFHLEGSDELREPSSHPTSTSQSKNESRFARRSQPTINSIISLASACGK